MILEVNTLRASRYYAPTLRKAPADADLPSHKLLLRGGFIRPVAAGVFDWLPLGLRVLRKVESIVREEMDRAGALEAHMPVLAPKELWVRSGRWDTFQPTPFRTKDRGDREFCLGPTHEELFTHMVALDLSSYRDLPVTLYQIQAKFRDEIRPRGGLLRVKEFFMKDAYSFDVDREGLDKSYDAQYDAYVRIFERLHMPVLVVKADAGSMGGSDTREFHVLTESGEDTLFVCDSCDYAANAECAALKPAAAPESGPSEGAPELVDTPNQKTIEQVCEFLGKKPHQLAKTLIYKADDELIAAMVRGDREINEFKLRNLLGAEMLQMADPAQILQVTGAPVGFSGPIGLTGELRIIADFEINAMTDFVIGANKADAHYVGVELERDFTVSEFADIREAVQGDACPECDGTLRTVRGIEMGHVFKLGTKYAEALRATFVDESGTEQVATMGCYGLGVSRAVAGVVELNHDDDGITWPMSVAPFHVCILVLDPDVPGLADFADSLETQLAEAGYEVMMDDRDERPGVKFKDADLIGYPLQVVIGRRAAKEGNVEVRRRKDKAELVVPMAQAADAVAQLAQDA